MDTRDLSSDEGRAFWERIEKTIGVKFPVTVNRPEKQEQKPGDSATNDSQKSQSAATT